jgi:type IV pilus assembly protein PilV
MRGLSPERRACPAGARGTGEGAAGRRARSGGSPNTRGAGLIEVLVALGVLSIGLLGIAHMLVHGMRTAHSALLRTQAVNLVADMAERIRANPLGAAAYDCASYASGPVPRGCAAIDSVTAPANCTAAELAEDDLARWQETVRAVLPVSESVCAADVKYEPGAVVDRFRVSLAWQDAGSPQPLSEHADVVIVRPAVAGRP